MTLLPNTGGKHWTPTAGLKVYKDRFLKTTIPRKQDLRLTWDMEEQADELHWIKMLYAIAFLKIKKKKKSSTSSIRWPGFGRAPLLKMEWSWPS